MCGCCRVLQSLANTHQANVHQGQARYTLTEQFTWLVSALGGKMGFCMVPLMQEHEYVGLFNVPKVATTQPKHTQVFFAKEREGPSK